MAWEHLAVDKPHLVYIILGGFTSLFMLCSSIIKEKLYIGEATVATICGIIFGPHAANLIDPATWGNTDQITLEFARIVLVVQCFAVGVELPRAYMERHWRSVVFLLVPVMTFGWLITSLFIWGMLHDHLNWLDSLVCAACVTATDPVLASSVVGKGKFAKRVPKHLRDLLSAESGCNDGMAFPFIYLGVYLVRYRPDAGEVAKNWLCITILYECIFGAFYGFVIGYLARRAVRYAHEHDIIDRESFLVFYFVLALFCAGSGSMLGMDDLLIGFSCGVGFSNDGWFLEKTEESHVSNVIDLLINLAFFVYFGTIVPWQQFNSEVLGLTPWRLVVIGILVLLFRRIPIMLALKPFIPDIKTWREALFAGHFGPIGVGAIFVAILARAEFETESTTPLAVIPDPGFEHLNIIELIWPITTFLVICSILVHGSSIAVFTLGKHINTLTITMSYTQGNDESNWMDRLPRIQSRSKSTMSNQKLDSDESLEEKLPEYPAASLPKNFLRRQTEEETPNRFSMSRHRRNKSNRAGGPISQSAISPVPRESPAFEKSESDTLAGKTSDDSPDSGEESPGGGRPRRGSEELFEEGDDAIIEDGEGNVLDVIESKSSHKDGREREYYEEQEIANVAAQSESEREAEEREGEKHVEGPQEAVEDMQQGIKKLTKTGTNPWKGIKQRMGSWAPKRVENEDAPRREFPTDSRRHAPARAFRFGRTVIVEDEDGEVIKKYEIPARERPEGERKPGYSNYVDPEKTKQRLQRMGQWLGVGEAESAAEAEARRERQNSAAAAADAEDAGIRFTMNGNNRRLSKAEFIKQIQSLDPTSRAEIVEDSNAPEAVKVEARAEADEHSRGERNARRPSLQGKKMGSSTRSMRNDNVEKMELQKVKSNDDSQKAQNMSTVDEQEEDIPMHSVYEDLRHHRASQQETAAERRRRLSRINQPVEEDSDDDGTERIPPSQRRGSSVNKKASPSPSQRETQGETAAERRRREGALGLTKEESSSEEDETRPRRVPEHAVPGGHQDPPVAGPSIRFADTPSRSTGAPSKSSRMGIRGRKK